MSFQEQASRWMRRCRIPVLTHTVGQTVLERPIRTLNIRAELGSDILVVDVVYERVTVQLTDRIEDFRYETLPPLHYRHEITQLAWRKAKPPKPESTTA